MLTDLMPRQCRNRRRSVRRSRSASSSAPSSPSMALDHISRGNRASPTVSARDPTSAPMSYEPHPMHPPLLPCETRVLLVVRPLDSRRCPLEQRTPRNLRTQRIRSMKMIRKEIRALRPLAKVHQLFLSTTPQPAPYTFAKRVRTATCASMQSRTSLR
jgi:hypothetical protein